MIAMPKLPNIYLDSSTRKFSIGSRRKVFQTPIKERTPVTKRSSSTATTAKIAILRIFRGGLTPGSACAISLSISLS